MSASLELPSSGVVVRYTDRQAGRQAPAWTWVGTILSIFGAGSAWPSFHLLPCSACGRAVLPPDVSDRSPLVPDNHCSVSS